MCLEFEFNELHAIRVLILRKKHTKTRALELRVKLHEGKIIRQEIKLKKVINLYSLNFCNADA